MLPARFTILSVLAAALLAGQAYAAGAADVELPKEVGKVLRKHRRYSEEEIKTNAHGLRQWANGSTGCLRCWAVKRLCRKGRRERLWQPIC